MLTQHTVIPKGYDPNKFLVWVRYLRLYRKTYVSSKAKTTKPLIVT